MNVAIFHQELFRGTAISPFSKRVVSENAGYCWPFCFGSPPWPWSRHGVIGYTDFSRWLF